MLWISCAGVWLALCVSFAVSAGIIGMPTISIAYEIVRGTLILALIGGAGFAAHTAVRGWRQDETLRDV